MTKIFVSASTRELGSFRKATRDALESIGVVAVVQERFPTDYRKIEEILKTAISECDAVICLVGLGYGFEPAERPGEKPRRSYTQMEYFAARELKKDVYLFIADQSLRPDNAIEEDEEKRHLQLTYRESFPKDQIRHSFTSRTDVYRLISRLPFRPQIPLQQFVERLPSGAAELFGRERELRLLGESWYDPAITIMTVSAWGGAGKTSLVTGWLEKMKADDYGGAEDIFFWPFFGSVAELDQFFATAFEYFGAPGASFATPFEKGQGLAQLISGHRTLLVLDGIDALLESSGPGSGRLSDAALKAFLEAVASSHNALCRLCVITSRAPLRDLDPWPETAVSRLALGGLDEPAAIQLLKNSGVVGSETDLRAAVTEYGAHPLTLGLLGRYLAAAHGGDIRKRDRVQLEKADTETQGGHAFQVMKKYQEWLSDGGEAGRSQLALLQLLGFFDRPADAGCLDALQSAAIPGLTDQLPDSDSDEWNLAISNLEKLGVVTRKPWEPKAIVGYSEEQAADARRHGDPGLPQPFPRPYRGEYYLLEAHPLVREFFADDCKERRPDSWRAGNNRLYEYLISSVPYWPEGLDGLQPLYQAVVHGCAAERHVECCQRIYQERIQRAGWGEGYSATVVGSVSADLAAVSCFFDSPWTKVHPAFPEAGVAWVLRDAAMNLEALGRLEEAAKPMLRAAEATRAQTGKEDGKLRLQAASRYDDLSRIELQLGRINEARASAAESCELAGAHRSFELVKALASLGNALAQAGQASEALGQFQQAEQLQRTGLPQPVLFSLRGYQYCDFLLTEVERAAWGIFIGEPPSNDVSALRATIDDVRKRAEVIIETGRSEELPLDQAFGTLLVAKTALFRALIDSGDLQGATEQVLKFLDSAEELTRKVGYTDTRIQIMTFWAWVSFLRGEKEAAERALTLAQESADRSSYRLNSADVRLYRARLFRDKEALAEARKIVEQIGYARRQEELQDIERELAAK